MKPSVPSFPVGHHSWQAAPGASYVWVTVRYRLPRSSRISLIFHKSYFCEMSFLFIFVSSRRFYSHGGKWLNVRQNICCMRLAREISQPWQGTTTNHWIRYPAVLISVVGKPFFCLNNKRKPI